MRMLPVKHNLMSVKGEYITLVIGYSNLLDASDLFACVRKYAWDEEYITKFDIQTTTDGIADGERCKITLTLDTNNLACGNYQYDLFVWAGSKPIKCLISGQISIVDGISNRGK